MQRILFCVIGLLVIARVALVFVAPPGVYIDEGASQAHIEALASQHTNAAGQSWPFYSAALGGGFTTPIYLYPAALWAVFFGAGEYSLRLFSQVATIAAIALVAISTWLLFSRRTGLIAAVVGLVLPWGWLQGSLIWDPALVPLMAAIGLLGWTLLYTQQRRRLRILGYILLPLGALLLAYVYPPYWVSAPLLLVAAYGYLLKNKRASWRATLMTAMACALASIPLLLFILAPGTLGRTSSISVFQDGLLTGIGVVILNFIKLLSPVYLFVVGDLNLRQSTGFQGMLGVAAAIPIITALAYFLRRRLRLSLPLQHGSLLIALCGAYGLSLLGAALTAEGQPHSLRSSAAWVFAVPLIAYGWILLSRRHKKAYIAALILAVASVVLYVLDYALLYPIRAASFF